MLLKKLSLFIMLLMIVTRNFCETILIRPRYEVPFLISCAKEENDTIFVENKHVTLTDLLKKNTAKRVEIIAEKIIVLASLPNQIKDTATYKTPSTELIRFKLWDELFQTVKKVAASHESLTATQKTTLTTAADKALKILYSEDQ